MNYKKITMLCISYIVLAVLLIGCGFKVKNNINLPRNLKTVCIQASNNDVRVVSDLKIILQNNGIKFVKNPKLADVTLVIVGHMYVKKWAVITGASEAGQYVRSDHLSFYIRNHRNKLLLPETKIFVVNKFYGNATNTLSIDAQTGKLATQVSWQLAYKIVQHLSKVKI